MCDMTSERDNCRELIYTRATGHDRCNIQAGCDRANKLDRDDDPKGRPSLTCERGREREREV